MYYVWFRGGAGANQHMGWPGTAGSLHSVLLLRGSCGEHMACPGQSLHMYIIHIPVCIIATVCPGQSLCSNSSNVCTCPGLSLLTCVN